VAGGVLAMADFYAIMGPDDNDNPGVIPVGSPIAFPQTAVTVGSGITSGSGGTEFTLASAGTYSVYFDVAISDTAQLVLYLNLAPLAYTMVGRNGGTNQVVGMFLVTAAAGDFLSVLNQSQTSIAVTTNAGGTNPVSAHLIITRVA
jgi:hypothetical protein